MAHWLHPTLTLRNPQAGFERVVANQGQAGVDNQSIDDFAQRLYDHLRELRLQALTQHNQPHPGKPPALGIPTPRDSTLHATLNLVLNPVLEVEFEDCSYAYSQG
jgi:retron-type reverse transcriptase